MSAPRSEHPPPPRRPLDSASRPWHPARSLQPTGGTAGRSLSRFRGREAAPRPTIGNRLRRGRRAGVRKAPETPTAALPRPPARPGPAPPEGTAALSAPRSPAHLAPARHRRSDPLPRASQRSRCPPRAGALSALSPAPSPRPLATSRHPHRSAPSPTAPGAGSPSSAPTSGVLHPGLPRPAPQCPRRLPPAASARPGGHPDPPAREAAAAAAAATAGERPAAATERAVRGVVAQRRALRDTESGRSSSAWASARVGLQVPAGQGRGGVAARRRAAGLAGTPSPAS